MSIPKVLIVNDNHHSLFSYKAILEESAENIGYEILTASSGEDALRQFLRHEFAVVLLDVNMPTMNGFETADAIHSTRQFAEVPIIFLTAHVPDEMNRIRGYQKGAVVYLCTPVIPQILQTKIAVFVNLAKHRMALEHDKAELAKLNADLTVQRLRDLEKVNAELEAEIAERKDVEARLRELSARDVLTGALNRRPLMDHIEHAIAYCARHKQHFALLFFDLDKFKSINDRFGHHVGDKILVEFATRLKDGIRAEDIVARFGGDEFVVMLKGIFGSDEAKLVADKIQQSLTLPYEIEGESMEISASVGIAVYPQDGKSADDLIHCSDRAMYHEKDLKSTKESVRAPSADGTSLKL